MEKWIRCFLRAFGLEGDASVLEQFNVSETIPWPRYRPQVKPGEGLDAYAI